MKGKNKTNFFFEVIVSLCHCVLVTSNTQVFYMVGITNWKMSNILIFTHVILLIGMACFSCVMQPFQQYVFLIFCKYLFIYLCILTSAVRLWTTLLSDVSSCHRPSLWCQKPTCNRLVNISGFAYWQLEWRGAAARAVFGRSPDTADAGRWESTADLTPRSIQRLISALAALNLRREVDLWMQKWPQLVKKPDHFGGKCEYIVYVHHYCRLQIEDAAGQIEELYRYGSIARLLLVSAALCTAASRGSDPVSAGSVAVCLNGNSGYSGAARNGGMLTI